MLSKLLYTGVEWITYCHNFILSLNDAYEYNFSDKELHFLVIGIIGMLGIFVIYPIFNWLAKKDHIMTITWIYVFTMIIVLTFAIEIGQKITHTGEMEFADIVFGIVGFLLMFTVYAVIRWFVRLIISLFRDRE